MGESKVLNFSFSRENEPQRVSSGIGGARGSDFKYLGSMVSAEGGMDAKLKHRTEEYAKCIWGFGWVERKQRNDDSCEGECICILLCFDLHLRPNG